MVRWIRSGLLTGILCILCVPMMSFSQMKKFQIEVDYATFRYDSNQVLLELYYSFHQEQMTYNLQDDGSFRCMAGLYLKLFQNDVLVQERKWQSQIVVDSTKTIHSGQEFVDGLKLLIKPGDYEGIITCTDCQASEMKDSIRFDLHIPHYFVENVTVSDIELAVRIRKDMENTESPFYKNTLFVLPNPSRLYSIHNKFLYFYIEIYNLDVLPDSVYYLAYHVRNSNDRMVEEIKSVQREKVKMGESSVQMGAIKVNELNTGSYTLHLTVQDASEKELTNRTAKFFVYNKDKIGDDQPGFITDDQAYAMSEFPAFSDEQLNEDFERSIYISKKEERKQFKKIRNIGEKRRWLFQFWRSRDENRDTPQNEYRVKYLQRVSGANERFRMFGREGWKTDRARVYILYGEPDYIDQHPNEENMKPYEKWSYDQVEGGVQFIFVDFNETKEYRLVHSTMRGEVHDTEWENKVRQIR